ncbi:MAG: hypothetical protein Q7R73_02240 [bacterium]|nr:hypothetical protein [bacterium]
MLTTYGNKSGGRVLMMFEPSISIGAVMVRVEGGSAFMPMVLSRKAKPPMSACEPER